MAIIGVSGKINSGKDTVGRIIQYLIDKNNFGYNNPDSENDYNSYFSNKHNLKSNWKIVKYANALKDIVCLLIGCTREQLEDREFKNTELGVEWRLFKHNITGKIISPREMSIQHALHRGVRDSHYTQIDLTPRLMLQLLGTEAGRNIIHPNIWVNALMSKYKCNINLGFNVKWDKPFLENHVYKDSEGNEHIAKYPNWIITDMRFPNELKAVKDRGGITIRVNRPYSTVVGQGNGNCATFSDTQLHPSETSLDSATFDFIINNDKDIEHLIYEVKKVLEKSNII